MRRFIFASILLLACSSATFAQTVEATTQPKTLTLDALFDLIPTGVIPLAREDWNEVKSVVANKSLEAAKGQRLRFKALYDQSQNTGPLVVEVQPAEDTRIGIVGVVTFGNDQETVALAKLSPRQQSFVLEATIEQAAMQSDKKLRIDFSAPQIVSVDPSGAVNAKPDADKPAIDSAELASAIPAGVLPTDKTGWNNVKLVVANEALAKLVGQRRFRTKGAVGTVGFDGEQLVVGLKVEDSGVYQTTVFALFSNESKLAIARLKEGDPITVEGDLQNAEFESQQPQNANDSPIKLRVTAVDCKLIQ